MEPVMLVIIICVFIAIASGIWYYFEKTKPKRIRAIKDEKSMSPRDDAFNTIQTTKSIMKVFKRKGKKVGKPKRKIEEAEDALDSGKFTKAKDIAEEAKDDLKDLAGDEGAEEAQGVQRDEDREAYTVDDLDKLDEEPSLETEESEKAKELKEQKERLKNFPENYLESKFELRVAREMMEEEEGNPDAERYLEKAEECFDTEDYTEALSYSVKCKKAIDEEGAGLIKAQRVDRKAEIPEEMKEKIEEMPGLSLEPEEESEAGKDEEKDGEKEEVEMPSGRSMLEGKKICPDCGYEGEEDDKFCPKCGTELKTHMVCPSCGNEVSEDAQFCPKCGTKVKVENTMNKCPECGVELSVEAKFCPNCGSEL